MDAAELTRFHTSVETAPSRQLTAHVREIIVFTAAVKRYTLLPRVLFFCHVLMPQNTT